MRHATILLAATALALAGACDRGETIATDVTAPTDGTSAGDGGADGHGGDGGGDEMPYPPDGSGYALTVERPNGDVIELERDLTGEVEANATFGSAHIGQAVAFNLNDTFSRGGQRIVVFNFGRVVGDPASNCPVQTDGPGSYPFNAAETIGSEDREGHDGNCAGFGSEEPGTAPAIEVKTLLEYTSKLKPAEGEIVLEEWGNAPGDVLAGTVSGTLALDDSEQPPDERATTEVEGRFRFVLPERDRQ